MTIPTHQKWRAGQLLRWMLTRDEMAVAAMAELYGAVYVEQGKIMHTRPETWDDVVRAYLMGDEPPTERSRSDLKTAIDKAELEIVPAWRWIYEALRSGTLDSWARPNGSGAPIRIDPIEYERFRFRSLDGHDFVIPVDIYHEPLCPRPLAEYLTGAIPATTTPTVWLDPLFSAQQAMSLWPPHEPNATSEPGMTGPFDAPKGAEAVEASHPARMAYEQRVAKFQGNPPLQTTKAGVQGDREWAKANGVVRSTLTAWRNELLKERTRGRPRNPQINSAGNSAGKIIRPAELTN